MTTAIILAGGLGTRLRSAVPELPKPMAPVSGRPFLEILMDYWIEQGVDQFILSVGYRSDLIRSHFGNLYRNIQIDYALEESPLGTGGGVLLAAQHLNSDKPFLILNGDTYFAVELSKLEQFAKSKNADWCFSLFRTQESGRYMGLSLNDDGQIQSFKSGTSIPGRLANGGVYWVSPNAIQLYQSLFGTKSSLEDDLFPYAVSAGQRFFGLEFTGTFIDIGIPEDYLRAGTLLS